jgi:hypothetical protein
MKLTIAAIATLVTSTEAGRLFSRRQLDGTYGYGEGEYEMIAGYTPGTQVTDHCAIDLDQFVIQEQLAFYSDEGVEAARRVYQEGGYSKSYAEVKLSSATTADIAKDEAITGVDDAGAEVTGKAYADYPAGTDTIWVLYTVPDVQADNVMCKVGGLPEPILDGCLAAEGSLTIGGVEYAYTYDPTTDNNNARVLVDWSKNADTLMLEGCPGCPYKDFKYFYDYYGTHDYADQYTQAAFNNTATTFTNGNNDFTDLGFVGKEETIRKAIAFMNIFMYVIYEFEDGMDMCAAGDVPMSIHEWDEGVCFFAGSLEGTDGSGIDGILIHRLIDKRCAEYKTCGENGDSLEGEAKLNTDLLALFNQGKAELAEGNCDEARAILDQITPKMYIPLIQGAMSYAFEIAYFPEAGEKERAEGATFAAAILPRIHAIDADAASTIYDNLNFNAESMDYAAVKAAFESVYDELGISCADVGGFYNTTAEAYYEGAEPCGSSETSTDATTATGEAPADAPADAPAAEPVASPASFAFVAHALMAMAAGVVGVMIM